jgi:class 3 adenylate cyclase
VLLLCLLASYISAARPLITAWTGISIFAMWAVARVWVLRDPLTIVSANIDVSKYKTMIALYHVVNQPHFFNASLWRADFYVAITATAVLTLAAYRVHRLAVRSGRQARLRDALATHFSPQIVELLAKSREIGLTRWSKDLAVLDCDLVGFTTLAEGLPPERVAEILQAYRAVVESAVFGTGGAIVSYTGDGVTAAFGLTDGGAPGATCAVACAQDIARNWPDAGRDALGSDAPGLAIGIDFGPASAGLVGEERALSLLLLGTPVDGAAELQAMTREVSAQILLSDAEKLAATASDPALATKLHPIEILGTTTWSLSDE